MKDMAHIPKRVKNLSAYYNKELCYKENVTTINHKYFMFFVCSSSSSPIDNLPHSLVHFFLLLDVFLGEISGILCMKFCEKWPASDMIFLS